MSEPTNPLVVFGDLHGHLDLFERLLAHVDARYPQARLVTLAKLHDPTWERVVVSAHTHLAGRSLFAAPRRVCVSATADVGEGLLAVVLPERRCWRTQGVTTVEVSGGW